MIITDNLATQEIEFGKSLGFYSHKSGYETGGIPVFWMSDPLDSHFKNRDETRQVSLQIWEKGLLVTLINANSLNAYWLIPFHQLSVYQSTFLSIHAQGKRIQLNRDYLKLLYPNFINLLLERKNEFLSPLDYYG